MTIKIIETALHESKTFEEFREFILNLGIAEASERKVSSVMRHASPEDASEWKAVISDVRESPSGSNLQTNDLLFAYKDDLSINIRNAADLPYAVLGDITRLSDAQVAKFPALLNRFDPEAAMATDTVFAYTTRHGKVIASAYGTREEIDGKRVLHLGNLNSDKSAPGIAVPLMAALIIGDCHWSGGPANGEGVARVMPNGDANVGSTKTMMRLGFYVSKYFTHPATLRNPQKGIKGSAEPSCGELKYLLQKGDANEIETRSLLALSDWTVRLGKSHSA